MDKEAEIHFKKKKKEMPLSMHIGMQQININNKQNMSKEVCHLLDRLQQNNVNKIDT